MSLIGLETLPVVFLISGNALVLWSRLFGVTSTIRLIRACADRFPLSEICLDSISKRIDRSYARYRYLFIARRQKCIIRGFLLYLYAKRAGMDVRLIFGASIRGNRTSPKWHCWIVLGGDLKYEVPDVIARYTPFIEFA